MVAAVRALRARPRLLAAIGIAAAVALLLPAAVAPPTRLLIAWDSATISYLVGVLVMIARSDVTQMRSRAAAEDEGAISILMGTSLAAIAPLAAIAIELQGTAAVAAEGKFARITLAGLTIVCSWLFVNVSFALHYAHECYGEGSDDEVGGLRFPSPGYEPDGEPRRGGALERSRRSNWKHGYYSAKAKRVRREARQQYRLLRQLIAAGNEEDVLDLISSM